MHIQPYLFFEGRCDEALAFYREALGAEVTALMRYKEAPDPPPPGACGAATGEHVMHASFKVGDTEVNASDGMASGKPDFRGFSLTLVAANEAEARKRFEALAKDGTVQMPLGKTFFSPCFGMAADRFGLGWMVIVL
ncbi:MAG TPA: VOC family protein [Casimicrobiaceae bacterium]|jgi:PhnB protein|nr:VOC family protein [Casimicrobiaceae bacterium]